jgi:hypothetical protein
VSRDVEQVKAISGYLHFLQRAVPGELNNKIFGYAERNVVSAFEFAQRLSAGEGRPRAGARLIQDG